MNKPQRRTKPSRTKGNSTSSSSSLNTATSSPASSNTWSERLSRYQLTLATRWQALSPRDQLALGVLSLFLLVFLGGYGGYSVNQAAKDSKAQYQQQVADYFWLRAQASNIDNNALNASTEGQVVAPATAVNSLLTNAGIANAQVAAVGDTVQLSFANPSQALVSSALSKLSEEGWQITQLNMQQDINTNQIQVQATLAS
jgi:type II secretory pathway component PulM